MHAREQTEQPRGLPPDLHRVRLLRAPRPLHHLVVVPLPVGPAGRERTDGVVERPLVGLRVAAPERPRAGLAVLDLREHMQAPAHWVCSLRRNSDAAWLWFGCGHVILGWSGDAPTPDPVEYGHAAS